jgi:hypothetical protein
MDDGKTTFDETVGVNFLMEVQRRMTCWPVAVPLNELLGRESVLAGYVVHSALRIANLLNRRGVSPELVRQIKDEVTLRMLVAIEAQRQAHYDLWRDLMGDPAPDRQDGDQHG